MKRIAFILFVVSFFLVGIKVSAKAYRYEWNNTIINIPVGGNINDYKNLPSATLYVDNVAMSDASITYLIDGDWLCYLADVNTSKVGEYEVWYKAYENGKYKPGTCPGYKCKIKFIVKDNEAPVVKVINEIVRLRRNSTYDVLSNLIISDNYSTELEVKDASNIDYTRLGDYEANVVVIDGEGNESFARYIVSIYENSFPIIIYKNEGSPINIELDSNANIAEYFTASDEIDGDLTDKIKLPIIDTSQVGLFEYEAEVVNFVGKKTTISFYVNIIDDMEPTITLTNNTVLLDYKEDFSTYDFSKYIAQIDDNLPIDYNNLVITNNIENKVGSYNVWYEYNDGTYIANATLEVKLRSYDKPSIKVEDISISVSESFDILDYVEIEDESDGNVAETIEVFDDGVDYETPGQYYIEVYVINSSGVSATKRIKLEITEELDDSNIEPVVLENDNNTYFIIIIVVLVGIIAFLAIKKTKAFKKDS